MVASHEQTVADVAKELGVTAGRLRQLCAEYGLGRKINTRLRLLRPQEVAVLRYHVENAKSGPREKKFRLTIDSLRRRC